VAAALVAQLRAKGHDVSYVAELAPSQPDAGVIALAQQETRLLLTEDKDFGELVCRRSRSVPGLVLIRIDPATSP
jgi:predicted nuclease of predicted toxin-antitoxin system